jgi:hypothetical protein
VPEEDRGLSPSELRKKQCEQLHAVTDGIARKYSEMWDPHAVKNRTAPEVLHEFLGLQ